MIEILFGPVYSCVILCHTIRAFRATRAVQTYCRAYSIAYCGTYCRTYCIAYYGACRAYYRAYGGTYQVLHKPTVGFCEIPPVCGCRGFHGQHGRADHQNVQKVGTRCQWSEDVRPNDQFCWRVEGFPLVFWPFSAAQRLAVSLTRVTKSYLLALGTTQKSSYFTKH